MAIKIDRNGKNRFELMLKVLYSQSSFNLMVKYENGKYENFCTFVQVYLVL